MQAVILAGGLGIRMGAETISTPKPMIKIGKMPILWHIIKNLAQQGIQEFLILGGYRVDAIREFFRNYEEYANPVTRYAKDWTYLEPRIKLEWAVDVLDTGLNTPTGGRLLQAKDLITGPFILTYGDGVADINIKQLTEETPEAHSLVTITTVHAHGRFGTIQCVSDHVIDFQEKPLSTTWINGGFWYVQPAALSAFQADEMLEQGGIQRLIRQDLVRAYHHYGFWQPMDTGRDKEYLESLWSTNDAPWKNWS